MQTILIADDNILDNTVIRDYLFNERYTIISANNGLEALELIEGRRIDLIILDMVMPVMDGFDFLKQFSMTQYYKEIPIIVISSSDDDESITRVLEYDVYDYLIKPLNNINKHIFINKLRNAIKLKKPNS